MLNRSVTDDAVVLLSEHGKPIGTASRLSVHTGDTPLHLAFSSYLFRIRIQLIKFIIAIIASTTVSFLSFVGVGCYVTAKEEKRHSLTCTESFR